MSWLALLLPHWLRGAAELAGAADDRRKLVAIASEDLLRPKMMQSALTQWLQAVKGSVAVGTAVGLLWVLPCEAKKVSASGKHRAQAVAAQSQWAGSKSVPELVTARRSSTQSRTAQHKHSGAQSRASAAVKPKRSEPARFPAIEMEHLTTHASYRLKPDRPDGSFSRRQMQVIAQLLRCHHTGKRHTINQRLIEVLYATARHYQNAKLFIVAGYRAPKIAKQKGNPRSAHKRGVACDFQLAGVSPETVRDYLREAYHNIGVGYYPNAGFVHVDVGRKRPAYWIDYSHPGERARYGQAGAVPTAGEAVVGVEPPVRPETIGDSGLEPDSETEAADFASSENAVAVASQHVGTVTMARRSVDVEPSSSVGAESAAQPGERREDKPADGKGLKPEAVAQ